MMNVHGLPSELLDEREQRLRYREIDAAVDRFRMKLFEGIAAQKGATLKVKPSLKT